jgi:hypothetical protein
MNLKFYKIRFALFCIAATLILAFSSAPPTGNSGAPGDNLCTSCHANNGGFDGDISISGIPADPIPNTTYTVTLDVDVTSGVPVRGGFQLVALDNTNDAQAGTWSNTDSNSSIISGGSRQYWGHSPSQNFSGNNISFQADWTAPNITDDVTFYVSSILGNGSGSSGDKLVTLQEVVSITGSTPIVLSLSSTDVTCNGDADGTASVVATGGTPPYEYMWSNNDGVADLMGLGPDTYSVTVTDDNGSTEVGSIDVAEPNEITVDPEITSPLCNGSMDAIVLLNATGGTGDIDCDWGFIDGCDQDGLAPGMYAVTLTDENMCTTVEMIEIDETEAIVITFDVTPADMGDNGSVTATATGGTGSYDFEWSNLETDFNTTTSTISDLAPGMYVVVVTDGNGCITESTVSVMGSECTLDVNAFINNIECAGTNTGAIQLVVDGAVGTPEYLWSDMSTGPILVNVPSGNYSVSVTDGDCMVVLDNLVIEEPDSLMVTTLVRVNSSCATIDNGRITIGINGGTGDYNVLWSNGLMNDTIINGNDIIINLPDTLTELSVGTYSYTVTDSNQCEVIDSITIANGDILPPFVMLQEATVVLDESGMAPAIDFSQVDAGSFDNCEIDTIIFDSGMFTCDDIGINRVAVSIIDGNGNIGTDTASIVVMEVLAPEIECSQSSITTNSCEAIFYSVPLATDNCSVASVELVEGLASGSIFNPGETTVTYRATDDCGNSADCSFIVTINSDLALDAEIMDASCIGGDGAINIMASGGTPPYMITPFESASNLAAGNYTFTLTDSGGCELMQTITIEEMQSDIIADIISTGVSCAGDSDGFIDLTISGGSGPFEITGDTLGLSGGENTITITDANGCSLIEIFTIEEPEPITVDFSATEIDVCTGEVINLNLVISGGTGVYEVDTTVIDDVLIVNVEDSNGCESSVSSEIFIPLPLEAQVVEILPDNGSSTGSATISIDGGTEPYEIVWEDATGSVVGDDLIVSGLLAGEYVITVTDQNGCVTEFTIEVPLETATFDLDRENNVASIFPSPASNILQVHFSDIVAESLIVIDMNGKRVIEMDELYSNSELNIEGLSSGVYLMQLFYNETTYVKTFVKL